MTDEYGSACLVVQADMGSKHGPGMFPSLLIDLAKTLLSEHIIKTAKPFFSRPEIPKFQIDIIINNAGVGKNQTIAEITLDKYEWQYRINVLGPLLLLQAALPYLPNDRSGRIVNVSSVSSSEGFIGQSVYGGTKAALEAMTRTWARELAERATINAINPGPVITDMWNGSQDGFKDHVRPFLQHSPLAAIRECIDHEELVTNAPNAGGRPAYPEEIGGIVGMLCTPDSAWCTGQVICANGGMRMVI